MDIEWIALLTSAGSCGGVIYAIIRNGARQKKQDEKLKQDLRNDFIGIQAEVMGVKAHLADPVSGLSAIKKSFDEQKLFCANTSTEIMGIANKNKEEINILRKTIDS